jgi:hypothetical protein
MANNGLITSFSPDRKQPTVYAKALTADLTLSVSKMGSIVRIANSNGFKVKLPNATKLTDNRLILITNTGSSSVDVYDNAGGILKSILAGKTWLFWNTSKTTSAGAWSVSVTGSSAMIDILVGSKTVVGGNTTSVCQLTSTTALIAYLSGSLIKVSVISLDGSSISVGTPISIDTYSQKGKLCVVSPTTAVLAYSDGNNKVSAVVITVSGTSVSAGVKISTSITETVHAISKIDSSRVIITNASNFNRDVTVVVLTISDTTLTAGSILYAATGVTFNEISICTLTSTNALIFYRESSTNQTYILLIAISGTTNSLVSSITMSAVGITPVRLNDSTAVVTFSDPSTNYPTHATVGIAGSTISQNNTTVINTRVEWAGICKLTSSSFMYVSYIPSTGFGSLRILDLRGDVLSANKETPFNFANYGGSTCELTNTKAIYFYNDASSGACLTALTVI